MISFEKKAMQKFNEIPDEMKEKILSNVYCSNCKGTVKIVDFTAITSQEDLLLKGKCGKCGTEVARLIEI